MINNFKEWFLNTMELEGVKEAEIVCWMLWKSRNEAIFEGKPREVRHICDYSRLFLQEYQTINKKNPRRQDVAEQHWTPPKKNYLNFNADAVFTDKGAGI